MRDLSELNINEGGRRSPYRSGRSPHRLKAKNPESPAARREALEDWGRKGRW